MYIVYVNKNEYAAECVRINLNAFVCYFQAIYNVSKVYGKKDVCNVKCHDDILHPICMSYIDS